jgi:type I restriction enzyme S subunit
LIFPDVNKLKKFLDISDNLFKKVLKNNSQIQELEKTRDLLLPKLMKGEILVD